MMKDDTKSKEELITELEEMRRYISELEDGYRRADELIMQSIHNWEETFDNITDMITIHDRDFNIIYANKSAEKILDLPISKISKSKCFKHYHGKESPPQGCPSCACLKTGEPVAFEVFEPHLNRYIEIRAMPQFNNDRELIGLIHIVRDISRRKKMEEALKKAHDELDIRVKERTADLEKANEEMLNEIKVRLEVEKALQGSESQFKKLSQEFNVLLDAIPDNIVQLAPDLEILWANKAAALELGDHDAVLKGQQCYKLCSNFAATHENCPTMKSFKSGQEETAQISTTDGRFLDVRVFPLSGEDGKVKSVIEVSRDITSKVRLEKEAKFIQAKLIHANKMTSLGTLVSGVAHEINNPNTFIKSNAQILSKIWDNAAPLLEKNKNNNGNAQFAGFSYEEVLEYVPKLLNDLDEGSVRIQSIVNNLRDLARPEKANLDGKISINDVIHTSMSILRNQIGKFTDNVVFKEGKSLPPVKGSSQQVEQVIINLIMNALQALKSRDGSVTIETRHSQKKNSVIISIADDGEGMRKEILERITEPFYTTKLDSGGTGLGLSISYAIIKEHRGTLEFNSSPGKGTKATITLPVYSRK